MKLALLVDTSQTKGSITQDEIIQAAEKHLGSLGVSHFQVAPSCHELNISPSIVNYHFKGKDELIARTAFYSYQKYVETSWQLAMACAPDAEKAITAWIKNQIAWAVEFPGIAACINFPAFDGPLSHLIKDELGEKFDETGRLSLINLATLIRNIRDNKWSEIKIDPSDVLIQPAMMISIAKIGWTILGLSTWTAGRHLPSYSIPQTEVLYPAALASVIQDIINQSKTLAK